MEKFNLYPTEGDHQEDDEKNLFNSSIGVNFMDLLKVIDVNEQELTFLQDNLEIEFQIRQPKNFI